MGIKGFLSFLSAPLIGALSDVWGRKFFLLITVFFTCAPIPLMTINTWWFFAMISISGVFAVTFSVVFAYVADVTEEHERSSAYGLVSLSMMVYLEFKIRSIVMVLSRPCRCSNYRDGFSLCQNVRHI